MKTILLIFSLIVLLALAYGSVKPDVPTFDDSSASNDKLNDMPVNRDDELVLAANQHLTAKVTATSPLIELTPEIIERANQIYTSAMKQRESANFAHVLTKDGPETEPDSASNPIEFSRLTAENQRLYDAIQASTSN